MSEEVAKKSSHAVWWILGIVLIGIVVAFFWFGGGSIATPQKITVAEYREKFEKKLNGELQDGGHPLRKLIEQAHVTVDVTQAYVSRIRIFTKDGSDVAEIGGKNNIRRVDIEVSTLWDGVLHKNGKTVLSVTVEDVGGKFQATGHKIIRTDAMVNLEDPKFWVEAGALLGLLLL